MGWVREDWDQLGQFLNRGLAAYTGEKQRRTENKWKQAQQDLAAERSEAYIAQLNEQMEASQERRAADVKARERMQMGPSEAWPGGPEDVPIGEQGMYGQYMEGQEPDPGELPISEAIREFFGEAGLPAGITRDEFKQMLPGLWRERAQRQKDLLDQGDFKPDAAMFNQIMDLEDRMKMNTLMDFAQQEVAAGEDPVLMELIQSAWKGVNQDEFDWAKVAEYLGPGGWEDLQSQAQYNTDGWLISNGLMTPGASWRDQIRQGTLGGGGEGIEGIEGIGETTTEAEASERKKALTDAEYQEYARRSHPSLATPGPQAAANIRAMGADPETMTWLGRGRYKSEGDWVEPILAQEQLARATGRQWPGAPSFGEETRYAQARRKMLAEVQRRSKQMASPRMMPLQ